jgi:hypothetical protein
MKKSDKEEAKIRAEIIMSLKEGYKPKVKQTAVEWLATYLKGITSLNCDDIIEQAKEMERDQLILFGAQCMVESEKESGLGTIKIYELYFDKTFKNTNK